MAFKTKRKMSFLQLENKENELILNTPNRQELLNAGCPSSIISAKDNLLGRGSFGTVVKANYKGKPVAVKIIKLILNDINFQSIQNEMNILEWKQENIVQIFKIEFTCNYGIVIMERFNGYCLQKIIDTMEIPLLHRVYIATDIISALQFCHKRNILHLDVKPQNILISLDKSSRIINSKYFKSYTCKLCDFGTSLKLETEKSQQKTYEKLAVLKGTLRYMAPEALKEEKLGAAADIYSIGITLWQMKYRHLPYYWLQCNEIVAYQVVKYQLRPNAAPKSISDAFTFNTLIQQHDNCPCNEPKTPDLSDHTLESLKDILNKMKGELIMQSERKAKKTNLPTIRQPLSDITQKSNATLLLNSRHNSNNRMLMVKRNLRNDFQTVEVDHSLQSIFKSPLNCLNSKLLQQKEDYYNTLYQMCWHMDAVKRPSCLNLLNVFKEFV